MILGAVNWDAIGAVGTGIGALATAVAAMAAWRAASASRDTSRDAMRALEIAIQPSLHVALRQLRVDDGEPGRAVLRVFNVSGWPATDLQMVATLDNGRRVAGDCPILLPSPATAMDDEPPYWDVVLGTVTDEWPSAEAHPAGLPLVADHEVGDHVEIRLTFWDERRIARYEQRIAAALAASGPARALTVTRWDVTDQRIRSRAGE